MLDDLNIRFGKSIDLAVIVGIYNQAIRTGQSTGDLEEYNVEDRVTWIQKFDKDNYPLYVAEIDNKVVGYCSLSAYRSGRKAMESIAEISYYIDESVHGKGIATKLIEYAIQDCQRIHKKTLLAILLDINTPSVNLLKKLGFKQWGHFPNVVDLNGNV